MILVAGGGIGGLTLALALEQRGFEVEVLEARDRPEGTGTGLALYANSTRILRNLGLEPQLRAIGHQTAAVAWRNGLTGKPVASVDIGDYHEQTFGAPSIDVHRGDLHKLLWDAASERANIRLRAGESVVDLQQDEARATVLTSSGRSLSSTAVVGADGIHSRVREVAFDLPAPRYTGQIAWRAIIPRSALPPDLQEPVFTFWLGRDRHLLQYPVRGGELVNIAAFIEREHAPAESWTQRGDPDEFRAAFAGWAPPVKALLGRVEDCFLLSLYEHQMPASWSKGRVALLGDACHAMLPHAGQGAGMAIEDARVLANSLAAQKDDVAGALRAYSAARTDRVRMVMETVKSLGRSYRIANPIARLGFRLSLGMMSRFRPTAFQDRMSWIWGYDVEDAQRA